MSTDYAGVAANGYSTTIKNPSDSDPPVASSFNPGREQLTDNAAYYKEKIFEQWQHVPMNKVDDISGWVGFENGSGSPTFEQIDVSSALRLWLPLPKVPVGTKITGGRIYLEGDGGSGGVGHSGLPATMPRFEIIVVASDGTNSSAGVVVDTSPTVLDYETPHSLEITGVSHTVADGESLYLRLEGEAGANAVANELAVYAAAFKQELP